ncbi:MAG: glycosyltransferase [Candidatus Eremiobacteraeota bacterium]|nr:glycosyltransferase [Candidatus Eremiobacteraeota bacterium]
MKVSMVSEHASPLAVLGGVDAGGQNVHVAALAGAMTRRGIDVTVYTRRDDTALPRRVMMPDGVTVEHVDAGPPQPISKDLLLPYMDEFAAHLRSSWSTERPDVVHSHFWMSGRAAIAAARFFGIPVVHTFHALGVVKRRQQGASDTSPPTRLAEEAAIIAGADQIIATCSDEVFELLRLGADRHRIRIVPCGVDLRLFRPGGPRDGRIPGRKRLVIVSRLVERKGIGNIIEVLPKLRDTELIVAGGPEASRLAADPQARRLLALARTLGVADRTEFRGRLDRGDVPSLMRSADIVVCVPWYEPFGIVPLEAMACGVPVVASAVGGLVDTVVDGVTGIHVPARNPQRLAIALDSLLADPARRASLGTAGASRAWKRYGWNRIASDTLGVYGSIVERRRATASQVVR